jgi:hypothetical protein
MSSTTEKSSTAAWSETARRCRDPHSNPLVLPNLANLLGSVVGAITSHHSGVAQHGHIDGDCSLRQLTHSISWSRERSSQPPPTQTDVFVATSCLDSGVSVQTSYSHLPDGGCAPTLTSPGCLEGQADGQGRGQFGRSLLQSQHGGQPGHPVALMPALRHQSSALPWLAERLSDW